MTVLIVEDDRAVRESIAQTLALSDIDCVPLSAVTLAKDRISRDFPGVVLSDIRMPGLDGFDLLAHVQAIDPDLPVILLTGQGDVPTAVEAVRMGAYEFLEKPCPRETLLRVLGRALDYRAMALKARRYETRLSHHDVAATNFPGRHKATSDLRDGLRQAAALPVSVHLWGEEGAGKGMAAHTIHALSDTGKGFVSMIAAELPNRLDGVLADERIGTLSVKAVDPGDGAAQEALRALFAANPPFRIVTASRLSPQALLKAGLATDVFYLLDLFVLHVPSLSARRDDIAEIFLSALRQAAREADRPMPQVDDALMREVEARDWAHNLPELRQMARRVALGLPVDTLAESMSLAEQMRTFERQVLIASLNRCGGRVAEVVEELQLPRKTLYDKLARHGLRPEDFRR